MPLLSPFVLVARQLSLYLKLSKPSFRPNANLNDEILGRNTFSFSAAHILPLKKEGEVFIWVHFVSKNNI
jgi:hypothetical protein